MRSLIDLKKQLLNNEINNLYVFTGEENLIRRIYYQKIGEIYGYLKVLETVGQLYSELEKKALFDVKMAYVVYNDMDYLKQREKVLIRLLELSVNHVVILVYDDIPEKSDFRRVFEDYITVFNNVTDDIGIKYVDKLSNHNIPINLARQIAFNCNNSYNNIVEEVNKYNHLIDNNNDHSIDAMQYAMLFITREIIPTSREFANAFVTRDQQKLSKYVNILEKYSQNILAYLPELYNTISILIFLKVYGKWNGGSAAYNAGEYWGRIKELREMNVTYSKNDLLDIRYLVNELDNNIRSGALKSDYAWEWLIGVIL